MTNYVVSPSQCIKGIIQLPGDKSISHRAVIFAGLGEGQSKITGFLPAEDTLHTLQVIQQLGVDVKRTGTEVCLTSQGLSKLRYLNRAEPFDFYFGNSGTGMRLLTGLLAGLNISAKLSGDKSLSGRPMQRIIDPLSAMGAKIDSNNGCAPLLIKRAKKITGLTYTMPVASAQIKSAILLAGLSANSNTTIIESAPSRDHTERMLSALGCPIHINGSVITLEPVDSISCAEYKVPSDLSSAFFFIVAACIAKKAELTIRDVGVNPTRVGGLKILQAMGANIELHNHRLWGNEPVADIHVQNSELKGINVPEEWVPLAIDEFPILSIAAAHARGKTILTNAKELRVKESDRIAAMASGLRNCGVEVEEFEDGMLITGGNFNGGVVDSFGDHRVAMSFAISSVIANNEIRVLSCENVSTSFPNFVEIAKKIGLRVNVE